ncbi:hypothetical protein ACNKHN_08380 [Shigella flexneri]
MNTSLNSGSRQPCQGSDEPMEAARWLQCNARRRDHAVTAVQLATIKFEAAQEDDPGGGHRGCHCHPVRVATAATRLPDLEWSAGHLG